MLKTQNGTKFKTQRDVDVENLIHLEPGCLFDRSTKDFQTDNTEHQILLEES